MGSQPLDIWLRQIWTLVTPRWQSSKGTWVSTPNHKSREATKSHRIVGGDSASGGQTVLLQKQRTRIVKEGYQKGSEFRVDPLRLGGIVDFDWGCVPQVIQTPATILGGGGVHSKMG